MKIKNYLYPQADNLSGAVGEAMALFAIPAKGSFGPGEWDGVVPPPDTVVVRNIVAANPVVVTTEIVYWRKDGILDSLQQVSPVAPDDEDSRSAAKRLVRLNLLSLIRTLTSRDAGPWGILRGVRPTKLAHAFFDKGLTISAVISEMENRYALTADKARLVSQIALRQRPFLLTREQARKLISVYIGIPYCPSRCLYCSFPAHVLPTDRCKVENFLQALDADIKAAAALIARYGLSVETIYIGGGTPTSLAADDFARLLDKIADTFHSPATREFTVEAGRPDSIDDAKISAMKHSGVTRVSVNPQSMQEKTLKLIGRRHTTHDIIVMLEKIRHRGIPDVNMDIIVGLPGEDEREITDTMEQIARLTPDNLTVHTLAIKKGSLLKSALDGYDLPREDVAANMLAIADGYARKLGMVPYYLYRQKYMAGNLENIGYAAAGREGIYNIQIMEERQSIIGIGPAAVTKAVNPLDWRLASSFNPKDVTTYMDNLRTYLGRREDLLARLFES